MDRPTQLYNAVRAHLDASRPPTSRRRRLIVDQEPMGHAAMGAMAAGGGEANTGRYEATAGRRASANGTWLATLAQEDARLFQTLHGSMAITNTPAGFYAEVSAGLSATLPASMIRWNPAGSAITTATVSAVVVNDEGEHTVWMGSVNGSGEFDGWTVSISQTAAEANINEWVAGTALKRGMWVPTAAFPFTLIATFGPGGVSISTDQDGLIGTYGGVPAAGSIGFGGLGSNEQFSHFSVSGAS